MPNTHWVNLLVVLVLFLAVLYLLRSLNNDDSRLL
jgi:flagellar biogenesis protein FliO